MVWKMNVYGCDQPTDAGKAALADNVVGQLPEEAFDKVVPRRASRGEVKVNARMLFDPRENNGMLVGGVIVMGVQALRLGMGVGAGQIGQDA